MASLIETLIDVLDKENTEYQGLLKLSEEKTTAIVNGNVERLQEILGLEQRRGHSGLRRIRRGFRSPGFQG